jgi:outer membrane protein TolC
MRITSRIFPTLAAVATVLLLFAASATVPASSAPLPAPLTLAEAQARLARVNPAVLGAAQSQEALQHQAVAASQLPDPELGLMAQNFPANSLSSPSEGPNAMLSLGISQRLPAFGQRKHRGKELQAESQAAFYGAAADRTKNSLALQLGWFDVIYAGQALEVLRTQRELESESIQAALARFRAGSAPEADVLRARLDEQALANRLFQVQALRTAARARIAELLNAQELPELAAGWPVIPEPPALATIENGLTGNPLLRQSEALNRAASEGVEVAQSEYYPDITVFGAYGKSYYPGMPNQLTLGIDVSLPIFTSRRQDQTLDAARARARASGYAYLQRSLSMLQRTRSLFAQYASLKTQLDRTRDVLRPTAKAAYAAALAAYTAGQTDMTGLLRTQQAVLEYALDDIQLRRELLSTQAELDYLATHVESQP